MNNPHDCSGFFPLDSAGRLAEDRPCVACGYNLRGLDREGRCPECGTAVGRSLHGNLLRYCDPEWVERLARGLSHVTGGVVGLILTPTAFLMGALLQGDYEGIFVFTLGIGGMAVLLAARGWWIIAAREPGQVSPADFRLRFWIRALLLSIGILIVAAASSSGRRGILTNWLAMTSSFTAIGAAIVAMVLGLLYLGRLCQRLPDEPLAKRCRVVAWGVLVSGSVMVIPMVISAILELLRVGTRNTPLELLGIPSCFGMVGFIGFGMMMSGLIVEGLRSRFRDAAVSARATWASDTRSASTQDAGTPKNPNA